MVQMARGQIVHACAHTHTRQDTVRVALGSLRVPGVFQARAQSHARSEFCRSGLPPLRQGQPHLGILELVVALTLARKLCDVILMS